MAEQCARRHGCHVISSIGRNVSIVQSYAFWHGLVVGLDGLDKHFSVHICEDFDLAQTVPDPVMRQALMQRFYTLNGSPEDYDAENTYQVVGHGSLLWYLARRIEMQLRTPTRKPKPNLPHLPNSRSFPMQHTRLCVFPRAPPLSQLSTPLGIAIVHQATRPSRSRWARLIDNKISLKSCEKHYITAA